MVIDTAVPPLSSDIIESMDTLQQFYPAISLDVIPKYGVMMTMRLEETMQLYYQTAPESSAIQLTFSKDQIDNVTCNPDTGRHCILFEKDSAGNEMSQIYKMDLRSKQTTLLSDGISQNRNCVWSPKGDKFVFTSTKTNGKDWYIYLCPVDTPSGTVPILEKSGMWTVENWSPNDSLLLVSEYISRTESRYYTLEITSGKLSPLIGSDTEKIAITQGKWSKDGTGIYFISDKFSEYLNLCYFSLKDKKTTIITKTLPWDIREYTISHNHQHICFYTNEHGLSRFYLYSTIRRTYQPIKGVPSGVMYLVRFTPNDSSIVFTMNNPSVTDAVYSFNYFNQKLTRWTKNNSPIIHPGIEPSVFYYPTFDSVKNKPRNIPCYLYQPTGKGPFPVVINIHGGPESQFWPYYNPVHTYLVNKLKCVILAPNVRGSNGYGKTYLSLDDGFKRENAVKDIGYLLKWISKQSNFDQNRIAVMGGSYGGYMSLASMVAYNDQLIAGVDIYGISNFITFMKNTKSSRVDLRRAEYGDERDSTMYQFLHRISPLTNVDKIKKPMLIFQGANDPRVPQEESDQIVEALKSKNIPVWYVLFTDEGHGFNRKTNKTYQENLLVHFLNIYLFKNKR
jgi:dipeptidyl aminopeptidase/acylaminoacyl peptidase